MLLKKIIKVANLVLMLIAFLFILTWVYENLHIFKKVSYEIDTSNLIISLVFINFFHFSQIIVWILIFKSLNINEKLLISKLYLWNNIYNYLPNRIFHFGGTVLLGKNYGFNIKKTSIVIINFQIFLLLSGIFIILPLIDQIPILKDFIIFFYLILLVGLLPPIFKKYFMSQSKNLKFLDIKFWYLSILISIISWFLYSYGLYSVFQFLDKDFYMSFLNFSNISILSNLSGSFVFFMPGGIGALETVFINLIDDINQTGYFLTSLILFRLLTIISSLLLIFLLNLNLTK